MVMHILAWAQFGRDRTFHGFFDQWLRLWTWLQFTEMHDQNDWVDYPEFTLHPHLRQ